MNEAHPLFDISSPSFPGLKVFDVNVDQGGVRSILFTSPWFEEYPTRPFSLHVLNGFMYAVIGLIDYVEMCNASIEPMVVDAVDSLAAHVNYFDTGTRTLYDLRHWGDAELAPNVARWDYHTLHVSQLYYLIELLDRRTMINPNATHWAQLRRQLKTVAFRWHNYARGVWNTGSQIKTKIGTLNPH